MRSHPDTPAADRWWHGAVLYQVYVRSWQDSDGDGYGDLRGALDRLDHLSWLGVDGIWLSPTMPSPDTDWGYDVSDYRQVHPELGTLDDLDRLIAGAGDRGMRVLLDLVPNHTSSEHAWFVDARSGPGAAHRDWYVWADPGPGGAPPNNWLDPTGAPAWTLDDASGQYYLHNFLPTQPDLNWWNPEVRAEFESILAFWFDRGVAGFRIDVAHALYKDRLLRDDPPAPPGPGSRFGLDPVRSMNQPEVHDVYRRWRGIAEGYAPPRLLLGETWVIDPVRLASFYGDDDELDLGFNFAFVFAPFTAAALSGVVAETLAALPPGGCPVWVASNHDISRFPTRWAGGDERRARLALLVLATLPGTVVLYAGDELALPDVEVARDRQRDPMSWGAEDRFNRDRCRTPMPWDDTPGRGFTAAGVEPWLPMGDRSGRSVADQRRDPDSPLALTRTLLGLRRTHLAPGLSAYAPLQSGPDCWVYRSGPLVVAANFTDERVTAAVPAGTACLASSARGGVTPTPVDERVTLGPWEGVVLAAGA